VLSKTRRLGTASLELFAEGGTERPPSLRSLPSLPGWPSGPSTRLSVRKRGSSRPCSPRWRATRRPPFGGSAQPPQMSQLPSCGRSRAGRPCRRRCRASTAFSHQWKPRTIYVPDATDVTTPAVIPSDHQPAKKPVIIMTASIDTL